MNFGSYEKFAEELKAAGAKSFGNGWAWLILENVRLRISSTAVETLGNELPCRKQRGSTQASQ
ncbi:MAG: hypothetical protein HN580_24970 [Deltaproteobacteria bacterium]|nr:hypothetical protein [Deltaproteobacteria bacterium]MBT4262959.1 hypothetical protein [Deltaproteobacteria bacterium]MBT4644554.1 hypothetical protein [Deltaproteobacteria bacterium]MBT6501435.1 hypothetical protein [Deltaproteobacteria bacterium]MBT6616085.1 hypothetical protein [Deltaproteobacteria bacterium]